MNRRVLPLVIGLLLLPLGCGGNDGPLDLDESVELCSDDAVATFEDDDLEAAIRNALSVGAGEPLTSGLMSGLTVLGANGVTSLEGIQNLTSLSNLFLGLDGHGGSNAVTDLNPLSGLTSLTSINLDSNSVTDISALSGLTSLTNLNLLANSITDLSALGGLTNLWKLQLSGNSITDIGALSGLTS